MLHEKVRHFQNYVSPEGRHLMKLFDESFWKLPLSIYDFWVLMRSMPQVLFFSLSKLLSAHYQKGKISKYKVRTLKFQSLVFTKFKVSPKEVKYLGNVRPRNLNTY